MTTIRPRLVRAVALGLVAVTALAACGKDTSPERAGERSPDAVAASFTQGAEDVARDTVQYVGTVEGTNAYIGITEIDGELEVYVCDGADLISWQVGTVADDGSFDTASESTDATGSGTIEEGRVTGTVTIGGSTHAFAAEQATLPAGVYQQRKYEAGEAVVAATIVLPDGTQRGQTRRPLTLAQKCENIKKSFTDYWNTFLASEVGSEDEAENSAGMLRQMDNYAGRGCYELTGDLITS
jgi:serine/threonine-protein kinase